MTQPPVVHTRRPIRWGLWALVALFIAIPIFEVWLLFRVGDVIGLVPTLIILIAEGFLGGWLMRREGRRAWRALSEAFNSGRMPTGELADGALVLVGGIMLMLPGYFTDVLGLFCLLPFTRPLARKLIGFFVARSVAKHGVDVGVLQARLEPETVIRGETIPDPQQPSSNHSNDVIRGEIEP